MGNMHTKDRDIVVPGEILAEGMEFIPGTGTYRDGEKIIAQMIGLASVNGKVLKLIPLAGRYVPKVDDIIIGRVTEILFSGWMLETNCAYRAMLSLKEGTTDFVERGANLTQYFNLGDYLVTRIVNVTSQKLLDISMKGPGLRKLRGGQIISMNNNKVPRVIGKKGSMIAMIKQATGCQITVGQNGLVWLQGPPKNEVVAIQAIRMIEENSHLSGLTEKVKGFLEEKMKGLPVPEFRQERQDTRKDQLVEFQMERVNNDDI